MDNDYLNGYAKIFGPVGTAIYLSLCRHADNETQKCFPAMSMISEELNINRDTVSKYINLFEKSGLISIERERDPATKKWLNNVYTLLDKSSWRSHAELLGMGEPCGTDRQTHAEPFRNKETHINKTHVENFSSDDTHYVETDEDGNEVKPKKIPKPLKENSSFGVTQRLVEKYKAALVKRYGKAPVIEKTTMMILKKNLVDKFDKGFIEEYAQWFVDEESIAKKWKYRVLSLTSESFINQFISQR